MDHQANRRRFLQLAGCGVAGLGLPQAEAQDQPPLPKAAPHTLTVIAGKPRERGRLYGQQFKEPIRAFLEKEVVQVCAKHAGRDDLLRYAGQCAKAVKEYSPLIHDELEGIAEGSGLKLEEVVLITLHEETAGHKDGKLPAVTHCTALAAAPPDTNDGNTYVGQNWDWMASVYGLSTLLHWKRPEGPSLLAYAYPGLWVGAGLNSAGVALCWTWGDTLAVKSPRVGIPAYVLIAQMLYQETLEAALKEVQRATHAGWFCFVLGDSKGNLAAVDGTPEKLVIQRPKGQTARASYACREILGGKEGEPLKLHTSCRRMFDLLAGGRGKLDRAALQGFCGDHQSTICKHPGDKKPGGGEGGGFTVDSMLFNCTTREAYLQRGPGCRNEWQRFTFEEKKG